MDTVDSDSDHETSPKDSNLLNYVAPGILAELSHLDLSQPVIFKESRVIGGGAYGDICKARCTFSDRGKIRVAIKRLRFYLKEDIKTLFEKEIYVWAKLSHANILPLLGYAFDNQTGFPLLVSEWMNNGSAWTFVLKYPGCDLMRLVTGIARGLAYLHEKGVVHSDIKSDNVLVTDSEDALICNFGCSRMLVASRTLANMSTGVKGTPQYSAYELLALPGQYLSHSKETDVWAFGMTIFELLAHQRPYAHISAGQVVASITRLELPSLPSTSVSSTSHETKRRLWNICLSCWNYNPAKRANMTSILKRLLADGIALEHDQTVRVARKREGEVVGDESRKSCHAKVKRSKVNQSVSTARDPFLHFRPSSSVFSSFPPLPLPTLPLPTSLPPPPPSPPPVAGLTLYSPPVLPPVSGGAFLDNINLETLPADLKKEGPDRFAIFNPKVKRVLDVNLTNTLVHESVVCCVRFSADGKYLATGYNRTAQIYDTKTGQKICILNDETASPVGDLYIRSVCFSPDGKLLATGAEDKTIRIWEIAKKRVKRVFEGHQQEIYSLDFSKNGRLIVSGSGDRTTRIWDMETGMQKVLEINEPDGVDAGVTSVAISPDGRLVAAGSLDTVVRIWEVQTGNLVERLKGHRDSVYSVAFTPDGKGIVSGSLDKTLKQWDISAIVAGPLRKEPLPPPTTPTGSTPASGSGNGSAVVRAKEGGERGSVNTLNFTGHKDYVLDVAVSHDGQWVVGGSKGRGVLFWEQRTGQVQFLLQGHKNSVISVDLSPTGGILATGSGDYKTRLWSYTTI